MSTVPIPPQGLSEWVATGYGALDVSGSPQFDDGVEIIVVPAIPDPPHALPGLGARIWRKLASGPIPEASLDADELAIVQQMEMAGLASTDASHPHRIAEISAPWLSSPTHELVYALVQRVAENAGIKVVFIKGPALHRQGLRSREHSGDVDLWVEPGREKALTEALLPWGWRPIPFDFAPAMYHSFTLEPPEWACEIDAHYRYPGIGADVDLVFSRLYSSAERFEYAGVPVRVPAVAPASVLNALHLLRPDPKLPVTDEQRSESVTVLNTAGPDAIHYAQEFGALPVLKDSLVAAFPGTSIPPSLEGVPDEWRRRQATTMAGYHFALIRGLPWRERPRAVMQVIWPSGSASELSNERRGVHARTRTTSQLRRLCFGVGSTLRQAARRVFLPSRHQQPRPGKG